MTMTESQRRYNARRAQVRAAQRSAKRIADAIDARESGETGPWSVLLHESIPLDGVDVITAKVAANGVKRPLLARTVNDEGSGRVDLVTPRHARPGVAVDDATVAYTPEQGSPARWSSQAPDPRALPVHDSTVTRTRKGRTSFRTNGPRPGYVHTVGSWTHTPDGTEVDWMPDESEHQLTDAMLDTMAAAFVRSQGEELDAPIDWHGEVSSHSAARVPRHVLRESRLDHSATYWHPIDRDAHETTDVWTATVQHGMVRAANLFGQTAVSSDPALIDAISERGVLMADVRERTPDSIHARVRTGETSVVDATVERRRIGIPSSVARRHPVVLTYERQREGETVTVKVRGQRKGKVTRLLAGADAGYFVGNGRLTRYTAPGQARGGKRTRQARKSKRDERAHVIQSATDDLIRAAASVTDPETTATVIVLGQPVTFTRQGSMYVTTIGGHGSHRARTASTAARTAAKHLARTG